MVCICRNKSVGDILASKLSEEGITKLAKALEEKAFVSSKTAIDYKKVCKDELGELRKSFATAEYHIAVLGSADVGKYH